jgi:recombination protein RecR
MKQVKFLDELVSCFEKLPGVGQKTALRYAYYVVEKYNIEDIEKVCNVLIETFYKVHKCDICGMITTEDICDICSDSTRDTKKILVVKDPKDLLSIEKAGGYNGKYHVLGGLISAFDGVKPDDLNFEKLENRIIREIEANKNLQINTMLRSLLPKNLVPIFLKVCKFDETKKLNSITVEDRKLITKNLDREALKVEGQPSIYDVFVLGKSLYYHCNFEQDDEFYDNGPEKPLFETISID